ncbi:unnamed protein product [Ceratitis capitata]|uniref:(Mediterranean fruit fly) hypothetical protein n=1 Tax=Ceratitis capitata TaxID=7213 RepID=A0A811ULV7_CERCA|nr:unnamed protein product [Ceratitis capitata]
MSLITLFSKEASARPTECWLKSAYLMGVMETEHASESSSEQVSSEEETKLLSNGLCFVFQYGVLVKSATSKAYQLP